MLRPSVCANCRKEEKRAAWSIGDRFSHWFCPKLKKMVKKTDEVPEKCEYKEKH